MPRSEAYQALGMGAAQLLETKKVGLWVDGSWALSGLSRAKIDTLLEEKIADISEV